LRAERYSKIMNENNVDIVELLVRCCDGVATEVEMFQLDKLLEDNQKTLEYVVDFLMTLSCLHSSGSASSKPYYSGDGQADQEKLLASHCFGKESLEELPANRFQIQDLLMKVLPFIRSRIEDRISSF